MIRTDTVKCGVDVSAEVSERVGRKVLQWLGHVELMTAERMSKKGHELKPRGRKDRVCKLTGDEDWESEVKSIMGLCEV